MVVTLDGPAGAGKSSAARALAQRLGFDFLDTGAMYRAVAVAAMRRNVPWGDERRIAALARAVSIRLEGERVFLDDQDVSQDIRGNAVSNSIHFVADNAEVRTHLVEQQRRAAAGRNIVTEGRDQGTLVFPDAECKIYLTASAEERARRRTKEMRERQEQLEVDEVLTQIRQRDERDESRAVGRLAKASDAVEVLTDGLTLDEVVDRLESLVRQRQAASHDD